MGTFISNELISCGYKVSTITLPPLPAKESIPKFSNIYTADLFSLSDKEIKKIIKKMDAVIYAAGLDDRVMVKKPAYPKFLKANVTQCSRFLDLAKEAGVKKAVILGSYFTYMHKKFPKLKLTAVHPYINSRNIQLQSVLKKNCSTFQTMVLELPYIFGAIPGKTPIWKPLVTYLNKGPVSLFPRFGGTAVVSVQQTAKACVTAVETLSGGKAYPVFSANFTWSRFISIILKSLNKKKLVLHLPKFMFRLYGSMVGNKHKKKGMESGLDLARLADIQYKKAFIRQEDSPFNLSSEDLNQVFLDTINECIELPQK